MEAIEIKAFTDLNYDITKLKSVDEMVKGSASFEAKKGHLVFQDASTGVWTGYALSASLASYATSADAVGGYVGVLLEDAALTTSPKKLRVAIAGEVYIDFIRNAGITAEKCSDALLRAFTKNQTAIVFLDAKKEA